MACSSSEISTDLLRELDRFHLGLDNLESNNATGRLALLQYLSAVADGEAAFSKLFGRCILNAVGFAHQ